jgi:hypothetical protein
MSYNLNQAPESVKAIPSEKVNELDVRPILRSGGEPFGIIMQTIKDTASDGAMRLRATFEPLPLFRVLGSQGWSHWVEFGKDDEWIIWFYREGACPKKSAAEMTGLVREFPELSNRLKTSGNTWTLDVRRMAPPEPMELTLAVVEKLPNDVSLIQLNERIPQFLLPLLAERGMSHRVLSQGEGDVRIEIRRE